MIPDLPGVAEMWILEADGPATAESSQLRFIPNKPELTPK